MKTNLILTGIVLSVVPIGDYDKRVTLLTKERGKISAFARGVRKQGSQLVAATNPFVFGEFEVVEGRSSYHIVRVSVSNYFRELVDDFENVYYGFYFLELADYYSRENLGDIHMLKLLYQSLRALEKDSLDNSLVRVIYELKSMVIHGEYPDVFSCRCCKIEEHLQYFSTDLKGVLCESCRKKKGNSCIPMNESALYALQFIITADIQKLYTFSVSDEVLKILQKVVSQWMKEFTDKNFKSLEILKEITEIKK